MHKAESQTLNLNCGDMLLVFLFPESNKLSRQIFWKKSLVEM